MSEKVATFSGIKEVEQEKQDHTSFGNSVDTMEADYIKFKKNRQNN